MTEGNTYIEPLYKYGFHSGLFTVVGNMLNSR